MLKIRLPRVLHVCELAAGYRAERATRQATARHLEEALEAGEAAAIRAAVRAHLGDAGTAVWTSDGRDVHVEACACPGAYRRVTEWVRWEMWTPAGRSSHGYGCPECRGVTRSGSGYERGDVPAPLVFPLTVRVTLANH